jgi:hypothetical protein
MPGCGLGKGRVSQEISGFFFINQCPPGPGVFHWGRFEFFSKILGDIRESIFITGVNDTGDKLFTGVNDSGMIILSPRIFEKSKRSLWDTQGPGDTDS